MLEAKFGDDPVVSFESNYSRMDQVKYVENSL